MQLCAERLHDQKVVGLAASGRRGPSRSRSTSKDGPSCCRHESAAAEIQIRPPSTAKTAPNPVVIHAHSNFRRKRSLNRPVRGHLGPLSASAPSSAFPTGSTSKVKSSGPAFSKYNVASTDCPRPIGAERPTCMARQLSAPRQYSPLLGFRDRPLSGASWRRRPPRGFGGFHLGFRWRAGGPVPVLVRIIWTAAVSAPGVVVTLRTRGEYADLRKLICRSSCRLPYPPPGDRQVA